MHDSKSDYADLVESIGADKPHLQKLLRFNHEGRVKRLREYRDGARLNGLDELLAYLEQVEQAFSGHPGLGGVSFLVTRTRGAFGVSIEAVLSGLHSVAHDAMRSVMEIEFLLRDFAIEPVRMLEWLNADDATLRKRFQPVKLRERFAAHVGCQPSELPESTDYKGHSQVLHVGPRPLPFGIAGLVGDEAPFATESCFWEIFEHARRWLTAAKELADAVDPDVLRALDPQELKRVGNAWERTQEMQQLGLQIMGTRMPQP